MRERSLKIQPTIRFSLIILLTLLIPIIPFVVIGELPGARWLSATDENSVLFGLTGMGLLAVDVFLPVPSSIIGTMLGARLDFLAGWLWGWAGLIIGNSIGYLAGRLLLSRFTPEIQHTPSLIILFISRPVPVLAEAMTFTCGAEKMKFSSFLMISAIGNGIYALALAGNGATLLPDTFAGPGLILPMLIPVVTWLIWRWYVRKNKIPTQTR